jgi:hypothetical protein
MVGPLALSSSDAEAKSGCMGTRPAGWYADPVTVGAARYHDGRDWTHQVSWGGAVSYDRTPIDQVDRLAAVAEAATIESYILDARERGLVDSALAGTLLDDVGRSLDGGATDASTPVQPGWGPPTPTRASRAPPARRPPARASSMPDRPVARGQPLTPTYAAPAPPRVTGSTSGSEPAGGIQPVPGAAALWWSRVRQAVKSDLALHGLAYLGVLLMFAGVTGLIVFSFGDIRPAFRALAELLVPATFLIAAWYLQHRGASVVSAALMVLGGATLPLVAVTALTDGAPFPPDLTGPGLAFGQASWCAVIAIGMALVVRRSPSSPLRFLCAPVLWMGAGLAAAAFRDQVPTGYDVARPDALQLSAILLAVMGTILVIAWQGQPGVLGAATVAVALPVTASIFVLELILAGSEGWPLASTVLAGGSVVVLTELLGRDRQPVAITIAQLAVIIVTGARVAVEAEPAWTAAGTAVVLLALVEFAGRRRPTSVGTALGLGAAGVTLLFTLPSAEAAIAAFGVATIWSLWRHAIVPSWLLPIDTYGAAPAALATIMAAQLWRLTEPGPALVTVSAAVLVAASAGRWRPTVAADPLWIWSVPVGAVAVSMGAAAMPWTEARGLAAVATAIAALALLLSIVPLGPKTWLTAGTAVWSLVNLAAALEIDRDVLAIGLATLGAALVIASLRSTRPIAVHLAFVGHAAGFGAPVAPSSLGWSATYVVAAATTAVFVTSLVNERFGAVQVAWIRTHTEDEVFSPAIHADDLPVLLTMLGLAGSALLAADASGAVPVDGAWAGAVIGVAVLMIAVAVRLVPWRRANPVVLAWATLLGSIISIAVVLASIAPDPSAWPSVVALGLGIAVVLVAAPPAPAIFAWIGWAEFATLTVVLVDHAGLDAKWADVVLAAWGAAVLLSSLTVDRVRHGSAPSGTFVRTRLLLAPATLGAIALAIGGLAGLADGTNDEIGWTAAGLAFVVLATAALLSLGSLGGVAESLATTAYVLLAPWQPIERPWTLVPLVIVVLLIAWAAPAPDLEPVVARWDLPSFVVAHGIAVTALLAAIAYDIVPPTFVAVGVVSIAVSVVLRRWPWAAAGSVLVLVAAGDAGHGWLAMALLVEGVGSTVLGVQRTSQTRWMLVAGGAAAIALAWVEFVQWRSWSAPTVLYVTGPGSAAVSLVAAVSTRARRVPHELALVWVATGTIAAGLAMIIIGDPDVAHRPGGLTVAAALVLLAAAAAVLVTVLGPAMRWITATLSALVWLPVVWAFDPTNTTITVVSTSIAMTAMAVLLGVHAARPSSAWISPGSLFAVLVQIGGAAAALDALPSDRLLIAVLLAAAAELLALGVITEQPTVVVASPVSACAAWLLYAREALSGNANWFTVPIGVTLLVTVGLVRWVRRGRGGSVAGVDIVVLELIGMSFVVSSALARTLAGHLWNALLAVGLGVLLAAWGVVTKVRRRAAFGAGSIVLAVVLLIGVPLVDAAPWRGPGLWVTVTAIGLAATIMATMLERGRSRLEQMMHHLGDMTEGWERSGAEPARQGASDESADDGIGAGQTSQGRVTRQHDDSADHPSARSGKNRKGGFHAIR